MLSSSVDGSIYMDSLCAAVTNPTGFDLQWYR